MTVVSRLKVFKSMIDWHFQRFFKIERQPSDPNGDQVVIERLFDVKYYVANNVDVKEANVDPILHFMEYGWRERRNPNPNFDTDYYLQNNPDVAAADMNPLLHYALWGFAEGRLIREPQASWRKQLAMAIPIRQRAESWESNNSGTRVDASVIFEALHATTKSVGCALSLSHDDYRVCFGGVQNLIGDEEKAFNRAGWRYLQISPLSPMPILADLMPPARFCVKLRLDGGLLGIANFEDLIAALSKLKSQYDTIQCIIHHLLGHVPELVAELCDSVGTVQPVMWVHDFFSLCPGYNLMRNDIEFCGAPKLDSPACGICCYGGERSAHVARMHHFVERIRPKTLAPSQIALDTWIRSCNFDHIDAKVVPLARLEPLKHTRDNSVQTSSHPLRVAHLGARAFHKGWPVFDDLARQFKNDKRYSFYQLGWPTGEAIPEYISHIPVSVDSSHRDAMIEATINNGIDIVVNWSLWPETFSYAAHEALAAGACVVARVNMGNVWPVIEANASNQGFPVVDTAQLFALFEGDELSKRTMAKPAHLQALILGGGTADFLWGSERPVSSQSRHFKNDAPRPEKSLRHE